MLVAIFLEMIFSPILEAVEFLSEKWDSISIVAQKGDNLYSGFGFKTTKQAFLDEVDYLYERYDEQLDVPLIMATLYYTEQGTYDEKFDSLPDISEDGVSASVSMSSILSMLKEKIDETHETVDEDGMRYTAGKIYRLRRLALEIKWKNPSGLGDATPTDEETIPLSDFIEEMSSQVSTDVKNVLFLCQV